MLWPRKEHQDTTTDFAQTKHGWLFASAVHVHAERAVELSATMVGHGRIDFAGQRNDEQVLEK
jgi:hypothetical protein